MQLRLLMLLHGFMLGSCVMVATEHHAHADTASSLRNAADWTVSSGSLRERITDDRDDPILVPDFYRFWPGHPARGTLLVLSRDKTPFTIESVTVRTVGTTLSATQTVQVTTNPQESADGIWLDRVPLVDVKAMGTFGGADAIVVTVTWREPNDDASTITAFHLDHVEKKNVAWVT